MIIPGMVSATFREKSADDIIRLCKEADLQAVEWSENAHVMPGDPEGAAELLKKTQMVHITVWDKMKILKPFFRLLWCQPKH